MTAEAPKPHGADLVHAILYGRSTHGAPEPSSFAGVTYAHATPLTRGNKVVVTGPRSRNSRIKLVAQSGAIVVRPTATNPQVLLVTPRRDRRRWIFPKGHIERGESARTAALREAEEEAGVVGDIIGRAGVLRFESGVEHVRVEYFVIRLRSLHKAQEGRQLKWCSLRTALKLLSHDDSRELLERSQGLVERAAAVEPNDARPATRTRLLGARRGQRRRSG